ncbi:General transcription and DNA repair factor IIH helicase subunit XPD [Linum perenne]
MKFQIEEVTVYFPYDNIYPEQYSYMVELKRALDAKGHCLLEMPTGTGKTIALLSLITSYLLAKPESPIKLIYCTRTVHEMEKTLAELKLLHNYQVKHIGPAAKILAIGLSSRKNLCVNPAVSAAENRDSVDAACRKRTASWVRAAAADNPNVPTCEFFENYEAQSSAELPPGVYTLEDLRAFGKEKGWCPYFLARHMVQFANVVVYSYQYLLDPKVAGIISKEMQKECVVVFDEAHNIDNVCIEALSVSVRRQTLEGAIRNLARIENEIDRFKATDAGRLRAEYNRLVEGLALRGDLPASDAWLANPALPDDILRQAVRQAAQCVGRVIRSKADYGMMIFADKRYSRHDKRSKLPGWILSHLRDANLNLSTDMALHIAREFLRKMAQPYDKTGGASGRKTLLSQEDIERLGERGVQDMVY